MKCAALCLSTLLALPSLAWADATADCKKASEALAPARSVLQECEDARGANQCAAEASQLFEVGITALERCGPLEPQAICSSLGDPRKICTSEAQCQRAELAWGKYCSKP